MGFKKTLIATAVTASILSMTGCNESDSTDNTTGSAGITTLTNDNIYMLASGFPGTRIGNGHEVDGDSTNNTAAKLVIEPGTLILGSDKEALIVTRGSKIEAIGTAADPIVMTSKAQFDYWVAGQTIGGNAPGTSGRGEWAGLALMGYAKSNECADPCDVEAEGGVGAYGGTNDADSSGTLKYVVVRHAGNEITAGNELNGITLFATGSGTVMDYIQVHKGLDDGIEHFGGSDFMSHVVLTDNRDDSFDWGQGYTGGVQYMVVKQANDEADRAIEADNDKDLPNKGPISLPTLANMTLMGASAPATTDPDGILLRRGTGAKIYNSIVTGFVDNCFDVDEKATMERAYSVTNSDYTGDLTVDNTFTDCATNFKTGDQDLNNDTVKDQFADFGLPNVADWFANSGTGNTDSVAVDLSSSGLPQNAFASAVAVTAPTIGNAKFDDTAYAGAFDPSATTQWTDGWTVGLHGNNTVWEPASSGTLAGNAPSSDGSCPTGTTFVKKVTLPETGGEMDLCQLKAQY
ncbi:MAG: hypothetical protein OEX07_09400 [Gammaproteobacteria bacterium]|nr:hypothetical protein [Gammaproteobacteria bacterium]